MTPGPATVVAYAYGRRAGDDPVNRLLAARVVRHLAERGGRLVVTQRDLARWLDGLPRGVRVVVCEDHLPAGVYVNTERICRLAAAAHPGGPVVLAAHARHRRRALATHRLHGLPAVALDDLPRHVDRLSEQWWTRRPAAWWAWEVCAWTKVAALAARRGARDGAVGRRALH